MGQRFQMSDGRVVDTDNASDAWADDSIWDGSNHISVATGSQWIRETLYRSRRGRYYLVSTSNTSTAEWIDDKEAARWLLANDHEIPEDLREVSEAIFE
jgi:hypothetical protein